MKGRDALRKNGSGRYQCKCCEGMREGDSVEPHSPTVNANQKVVAAVREMK
jgi:hypothetical protein